MRNSKLYSILSKFNKYEQNRFRKYLQSPYFNSNQTIIDLFGILAKDINENYAGKLEKEWIWKKLKLNLSYDDVRFRKFMSDLLKLAEGFLAQQLFDDSHVHKATFVLKAVGTKKLEKLYNSSMRTAEKGLENQSYRSIDYFYQRYHIEKEYYNLIDFETKRDDKSNLEDIITNLDYFYFSEKLRLCCSALARQRFISHSYEIQFIDEIVNYLDQNIKETIPAIAIYYQIYLTYKEPDTDEHYFKLKQLLNEYALLFPHREAKDDQYSHAINYCVRKFNSGNPSFLEELFQLYEDLIQKEILVSDDQLSPWFFKNVVFVGLRIGKYDWTENFILKYSPYLPESFRDNAVTFNLARLYWYQKDYDKVIEQLREVEYEDVTYNLSSKSMLLATYYERDEIEPLYSLLDSFRVYLNRRKDIPLQRRENYKNLIKFTKKLTRLNHRDKKAQEKLREEIEASKGVIEKKWLLDKIVELGS